MKLSARCVSDGCVALGALLSAVLAATTVAQESVREVVGQSRDSLESVCESLFEQTPVYGRLGRPGRSEKDGPYFVVVVGVPSGAADPIQEGRTGALEEIASFLGVSVTAATERELNEGWRSDTDENSISESFTSRVATSVEQTMAGASLLGVREKSGGLLVAFAITKRGQDNVAELTSQLTAGAGSGTPMVVQANGVVPVPDGAPEEVVRQHAISEGLSEALRKTVGATVTAFTATENGDRVDHRTSFVGQGTVKKYEVLTAERQGRFYRVELVVEVDATQAIRNFHDSLRLLGSPRFALSEVADTDVGGRSSSPSPVATGIKDLLGRRGIEWVEGDPASADYQLWLDCRWRSVEHPVRGNRGVQLQAVVRWVDRAGNSTPICSTDGRLSSFLPEERAIDDCSRRMVAKHGASIESAVQQKLDDFIANGREVRVVLRGAPIDYVRRLEAALSASILTKSVSIETAEDGHAILLCRTHLRDAEFSRLIRSLDAFASREESFSMREVRANPTLIEFESFPRG